ncbi:MAG: hypothetical protein RMY16_07880 [Nostoc sp. DedQUE12b]|uniref:hypothetical protein n=1 Tax=Nostoc sp. DedQUE12b TaxID=3075398 RepID=UPI002AD5A162|nr:hypothetical protein [Nostoc sp. DedQUE12b]MDZ8085501.1 hypothetical protein [Nostoc sp. DedQUE12b]
MKKLQQVKVALRKSERWFRAIFNQTFGFIRLIEPIEILIEGNQVALKFGGITNSKVIRSSWWRTCLSDSSHDIIQSLCANPSPFRF